MPLGTRSWATSGFVQLQTRMLAGCRVKPLGTSESCPCSCAHWLMRGTGHLALLALLADLVVQVDDLV